MGILSLKRGCGERAGKDGGKEKKIREEEEEEETYTVC